LSCAHLGLPLGPGGFTPVDLLLLLAVAAAGANAATENEYAYHNGSHRIRSLLSGTSTMSTPMTIVIVACTITPFRKNW
jgi:hypothetical protein